MAKAGFFGHGALFLMVSPFTVQPSIQDAFENSKPLPVISIAKDSTLFSTDSAQAKTVNFSDAPRIQLNATASSYVKKFLPKNREELELAERRSERYFEIIERVFTQYNLPLELKYLAVVESQLKTSALSHAGAKGSWQLMGQTARDFGLKVNGRVDERTHFYKSTVAAAKYLKSLYAEFGDWLLVIAAYNGGSGTVLNAIKRSGSRNFWRMQGCLPAETRGHVKRFIGTHYYFQKDLSLTVLTKAETANHLKAVEAWKEQNTLLTTDSLFAAR